MGALSFYISTRREGEEGGGWGLECFLICTLAKEDERNLIKKLKIKKKKNSSYDRYSQCDNVAVKSF